MRPNGGLSSSGTQNMQSSTGQYSTQAGEPAQPVQHSVMTAKFLSVFFLARGGDSLRARFKLLLVGHQSGRFRDIRCVGHLQRFYLECQVFVSVVFQRVPRLLQCPCIRFLFACTLCSPKPFYKHLLPALLAGLGLRLFFIWHFPFYSGDTAYYEELARNWLYHGVYGFYSHGQLLASDARAPGYPAFLAAIYFLAGTGRKAVMLAQAFVDLATCVLAAGIASRLAADSPDATRSRVAAASALADGALPVHRELHGRALTEVLATFLTTLALLIFLSPAGMAIDRTASNRGQLRGAKIWVRGRGSWLGLGALVRPETPLLLSAVLIALLASLSRSRKLEKARGRNSVDDRWLAVCRYALGARNAVSLGRVASSRAALRGNVRRRFADRLFYSWTKNVDVSFSRLLNLFTLETAVAADRLE